MNSLGLCGDDDGDENSVVDDVFDGVSFADMQSSLFMQRSLLSHVFSMLPNKLSHFIFRTAKTLKIKVNLLPET